MTVFNISVTIDAEITVEADNEREARETAENEAYSLSNGEVNIDSVDILSVEEFDD